MEASVAAFWPAWSVLLGFLGLLFSGLPAALPGWLHIGFLALALSGFLAALRWGFGHYQPVTHQTVLERLEGDSGLINRPLECLEDKLGAGHDDPVAQALWQAHRMRLLSSLENLKVKSPRPQLAALDPFALRFPPVAVFILGLILGWGELTGRIVNALSPAFEAEQALVWRAEFWITPPVYTGLRPVYVTSDDTPPIDPITVPEGSSLLAQTSGLTGAVDLAVGGDRRTLKDLGLEGSHQLEVEVDHGDRLSLIRDGSTLMTLPLEVVFDVPPSVEFTQTPARSARARLRIDYLATDDYGVVSLKSEIRREGETRPISLDLPLTRVGGQEAKGRRFFDLASHPWSGLPVDVVLIAKDRREQTVESDPIRIVLPERIFNHPVARMLSESRKKLNTPRDIIVYEVAHNLDKASVYPARFFDDVVVFMGLRLAANRLRSHPTPADIKDMQNLFWDLALRIEDGEMLLAERELNEAQERLSEALADGADSAEIEQLMQEMRQAMQDYMNALAQELQKRGQNPDDFLEGGEVVASDDMMQMLDQAREMAKAGDLEGARNMMARLNQMLQSMQSAMRDGGPKDETMAKARRLMNDLRGLTEEQRKLLDETFNDMQEEARRREEEILGPWREQHRERYNQGGQGTNQQPDPSGQQRGQQQGQQPGDQAGRGNQSGGGPSGGDRQHGLRKGLGDIMRQMDDLLGTIPQDLGSADRAMRRAEDALKRGDPGAAIGPQGEALQHMQQATDALSERMARQAQRAGGLGLSQRRLGGKGRDPFGRSQAPGGNPFGDGMEIDLGRQGGVKRAQEILRELRRRSGEQSRPQIERDYIDRLLRRF